MDNNIHIINKLIKKTLHKNPYKKDSKYFFLWKEQCEINCLILFYASIYLYHYAKNNGCVHLLFATRDCCHFYKIFSALYPDIDVTYFDCSRIMFESATKMTNNSYLKYVKEKCHNITDCIYIDIHGTGKRMLAFFKKTFGKTPHCFLLSSGVKSYDTLPIITHYYINNKKFITLSFNVHGTPIEMLNYDIIGTLKKYTNNGPVRDNLEYNIDYVKPYHNCVLMFIEKIKKIRKKIMNVNNDEMDYIKDKIQILFNDLAKKKLEIEKHITHLKKHLN